MAKKLYGYITSEMDEFEKIRERVRAALVEEYGWPEYEATVDAASIAIQLEIFDYTDDKLIAANRRDFENIGALVLGRSDVDVNKLLLEAYGKA